MSARGPARFCLGTVQLGMPYGIANRSGMPSAAEAEALLDAAAAAGVRSLDTAAAYGRSEERVGAWLRQRGMAGEFEICSKLPPLDSLATSRLGREELAEVVNTAVESSLRQLGVDRIACFLVHRAHDLRVHGQRLRDALEDQQRRGRIVRVGVSAYKPREALEISRFGVPGAVQHPVSLFDRRLQSSGTLSRLQALDVPVHARSVLLQGLLTLSPEELPARVRHAAPYLTKFEAMLGEWELSATDAALAYAGASGVDQVVVGVETPDQLHANLEALARPLPAGFLDALDKSLGTVPIDVIDPSRWDAESE